MLWFRRDLRLHDHPALVAAVRAAGDSGVLPLFVLDPTLWLAAGPPRQTWLLRSLAALDESLDGHLVLRLGDPADVVPLIAREVAAEQVHVSADAGPYGRRRDDRVQRALAAAGRQLVRTGTPYAIGPGSLMTGQGTPFQVFSPFFRAWTAQGWPAPAEVPVVRPPRVSHWADGVRGEPLPPEPDLAGITLPAAGEAAARRRWATFRAAALAGYADQRDRPDLDRTSQLSTHLKYGELHPRTLLADLAAGPAAGPAGGADPAPDPESVRRFRAELCWREFYADVLWHRPDTARQDLRPQFAAIRHDPPGEQFDAWCRGRTGFPMVDAGMRQLLAEGWMHNRVRMLTASFLVKDLHLQWQQGARWFMRWLRDGDLASNQHGWQWTAGCGTDAAPYFRIFNPVGQGLKFDPDGDYVRRYVPELAHLAGASAHQPWEHPDGYAHGYPERIVDHAVERAEALQRYGQLRDGR